MIEYDLEKLSDEELENIYEGHLNDFIVESISQLPKIFKTVSYSKAKSQINVLANFNFGSPSSKSSLYTNTTLRETNLNTISHNSRLIVSNKTDHINKLYQENTVLYLSVLCKALEMLDGNAQRYLISRISNSIEFCAKIKKTSNKFRGNFSKDFSSLLDDKYDLLLSKFIPIKDDLEDKPYDILDVCSTIIFNKENYRSIVDIVVKYCTDLIEYAFSKIKDYEVFGIVSASISSNYVKLASGSLKETYKELESFRVGTNREFTKRFKLDPRSINYRMAAEYLEGYIINHVYTKMLKKNNPSIVNFMKFNSISSINEILSLSSISYSDRVSNVILPYIYSDSYESLFLKVSAAYLKITPEEVHNIVIDKIKVIGGFK